MKNKTALTLIEQVIMLLVLAVAAAVCLQIFVSAGIASRNSRLQDQAVQLSQNCAELLKSTGGDLQQTAEKMGGTVTENLLQFQAEGIIICAQKINSGTPLLGMAEVTASAGDRQLCKFHVCWQEVAE